MDPHKAAKIQAFDPSSPAVGENLFGLPFTAEESDLVILPCPWEATVSFGAGTARAPQAILEASWQVDLFDADYPEGWQHGFALLPINPQWLAESDELRPRIEAHLEALASGTPGNLDVVEAANEAGERFAIGVETEAETWLAKGKTVATLGGDHSTPLGLLRALAKRYPQLSILQLDAHADLRNAYEGFTYSHASIMHNALALPQVQTLVQVGVRDLCAEEWARVRDEGFRCLLYDDRRLAHERFEGRTWRQQCEEIVSQLTDTVYVSFDIDALEPSLCPHTGTPVPGGLRYEEALYLISYVRQAGKQIVGFDLSEVGAGTGATLDATVGAQLLFRLCNLTCSS